MAQRLFTGCLLLSSLKRSLLVWNQNFYYRYIEQLAGWPILSQLNPFHNSTPYFDGIHFNIILQSEPD